MGAPERGEVWLVDLGMAAKIRPCLVLSIPVLDTERALTTSVAHTTSQRGTRFEVAVQTPFLRAGVFDAQNMITVPHAKYIRRLGKLNAAQMQLVTDAVQLWSGSSSCRPTPAWLRSARTSAHLNLECYTRARSRERSADEDTKKM